MNTEEIVEHIRSIVAEASERGVDVFVYKGHLYASPASEDAWADWVKIL